MTTTPTEDKRKLSGKQRRHLRSLGHHLKPIVQLGKQGLTDGVIAAVGIAIETHELVKVRRGSECPLSRKEVAQSLAGALEAEIVQQLGHTFLLYRRHPDEPSIDFPA